MWSNICIINNVERFSVKVNKCILLYLLVLNVRHHQLLHSLKLSKSACKISQSYLFFNVLNILVSSANIFTLLFTVSGISFTYIKKRIGPNTDPCGTLLMTSNYSEYSLLTIIRSFLSDRKSAIHSKTLLKLSIGRQFLQRPLFWDFVKCFLKIQQNNINTMSLIHIFCPTLKNF